MSDQTGAGDDPSVPIELGIAGIDHVEPLAVGGNSVVFKARQVDLDRTVVVKVLRAATDPGTRRRFDRERKAMGRLSQHPGIVPIYEGGFTAKGEPFLIMPFYERGSLQDEMDRGPASAPDAVRDDMVSICEAVQAAHDNSVLHRDLKPGNILRARAGRPLVTDFGIARLTDDGASLSTSLTLTPLYSAPEVFEGAEPTPQQDVYALGAVAFAMLNGSPAYDDGRRDTSVLALMQRIATQPVPALPPGTPSQFVSVVSKAMAKEPGDRYASVAELGAAFGSVDLSAPTPSFVQPPVQATQQQPASQPSVFTEPALTEPAQPLLDRPVPGATAPQTDRAFASAGTAPPVSAPPSAGSSSGGGRIAVVVLGVVALIGLAAIAAVLLLRGGDGGNDVATVPATSVPVVVESTATAVPDEPTPVPDDDTPELVDEARIVQVASNAQVTVEGFACGRYVATTGVLVGDDRVLMDPRFVDTVEIADVRGPAFDRPAGMRDGQLFAELGIMRLARQADRAIPLSSDITTGSRIFAAVPGGAVVHRATLIADPTSTSGTIEFDEPVESATQQDLLGAALADADGRLLGRLGSFVDAQQAAVALDPATHSATSVQIAGAPSLACPSEPFGGTIRDAASASGQISSERIASLVLLQQLADALSDDDWDEVRRLEPAKATFNDQRFIDGWGVLVQDTLIPIDNTRRPDGTWIWRLGLVAHELQSGNEVTAAFCVTWFSDVADQHVVQTGSDTVVIVAPNTPRAGHVPPGDFRFEFQERC